jgi:hypothetical protein
MVKVSSKIKGILSLSLLLLGVFVVGNFALAGVDVGLDYGAGTGLGEADPRVIAANIIRIALAFLGIVAVGLMVYAGFLWMTASGNVDRVDTAKKILIGAVIGLVIVLSSFAIASYVLNRLLEATGTVTPGGGGPGGTIPPGGGGAGTPCDDNTLTPVCEPSATICASGLYCDPLSCLCRVGGGVGASCDSDDVLIGCQADGGMCMPGLFCDGTTCTCETGSGAGVSCDLDILSPGCQMSTTTCSNLLTCDPSGCTCEEWPIIEWISPQGGFCDDEPNKACRNDSDCTLSATSTCDRGTPNAAVGNIITIGGSYFGDTPGQVYFWNGSDFTLAGVLPSTLNPDCNSNWRDDQIIVVVPAGAVTGQIRVVRSDLLSDESGNEQGPNVGDLVINTIRKPGLCRIDPDNGYLDDGIAYYGINFLAASEGRFGNYQTSLPTKNSNYVSALEVSGNVPGIQSGNTTTFIAGPSGDLSNYLRFSKKNEDDRGPYIISFEPRNGAPGQYVTIYGSGFGVNRGRSAVYFGDETGYEADYAFPEICADSVWSDSQIVVKVPASAPNAGYPLTITIGSKKIDTSSLSPSSFGLDRALPLLPSLCKISPSIGDVGAPVSLWGEYFDSFNTLSKVRFYNNKEISGTGITFWDLDPDSRTGVKPFRADTTVAPLAVTGQVQIVKGASSLAGNGLNFRVGSCLEAEDPDASCSPNVCCPEGTYKSGRCAASEADCFIDVPASVYEWDFNTGLTGATTDTDTTAASCAERSRLLDMCDITLCPNSAGECSPFDNVFSALQNAGKTCSSTCDQVGPCGAGDCRYDSSLDLCISNSRVNCSLVATTTDAYGSEMDTHCEEYQGNSRRVMYIDESASCLPGWVKANLPTGGGVLVCVDPASSCTVCGGGYVCVSDGTAGATRGLCAAPDDICPSGSTCQADNRCKKVSSDECQCCCRKANANQDCCAPLTCEGTCGSDRSTNTGTYGQCSGCRIERAGVVDQTASDAACNCANSFGKYCDVTADPNGDGVPEGVCGDCAELATNNDCSFHDTTCCVDAVRDDICTSRQYGASSTKDIFSIAASGGVSYCGYYACSNENTACDGTPDVGPFASTTNYFKSLTTCQAKCSSPVLLGLSCAGETETVCDTSICASPAACLNDDGSGPSAPGSCGVCCCNPADDQCSLMGSANLRCQPDMAPCDGAGRGLCCGCSFNSDCVAGGGSPTDVGCGLDQCCRARPSITSTSPVDDQTDVCTNIQLEAQTDQLMNSESVSGNIIVVGEYATPCPEGTVYLAWENGKEMKGGLGRTIKIAYDRAKLLFKKVFAPSAIASDPPLVYMNYCAITGDTNVENLDPEKGPTILKFTPRKILDTDRKYFVIVKGDPALDNSAGVKNFWGIGMNIPTGSNSNTRVDNLSPFNGITYPSSYIWSFRTRPDQGGNKGVCDIDKVVVSPDSYLFSTNKNDLNENDTSSTTKSFDTVRDSDKKFTAKALSFRGETLFAAPGYSWDWDWDIVDPAVVEFISGPFSPAKPEKLVRAHDDISDRRTDITATVRLTDSALSGVGDGKQATSTAYVFLCENPWPRIANDGTWSPWLDNPDGLDCITGSCLDMRYEIYYCRDSGGPGTADDLPVLGSDVTRGSVFGSELLKESYFFRQTPPTVESTNLEVRPIPRGGEVELDWGAVVDPTGRQTVSEYKVYYGAKSGAPYPSSFKVPVAQAPYVSGNGPVIVKDLDKTKDYYFAITAVYANGEESDYSSEVKAEPKDYLPPARPSGLLAESPRTTIPLNVAYQISSWSRTGAEKVSAGISVGGSPDEILKHLGTFDIRWGTALNDYPNVVSVDARQALVEGRRVEVSYDFATGTTYYFIVSATRSDGSSAERAGAFNLIFSEDGSFESRDVEPESIGSPKMRSSESFGVDIPSGVMNVIWDPNTDDAVKYKVYWGTNHASYGQVIDVSGRDASAGESEKKASFNYTNTQGQFFITVTAIDAAGNESERADEIILIPSQSAYTYRNALTNVGFEDGALGGVPTNWSVGYCCNGTAKVSTGISNATAFSGGRSLRLWQAPDVPYPGACGDQLMGRVAPAYDAYPSSWLPTYDGSTCTFRTTLDCNSGGPCVASRGAGLPWPYSNRVMWSKVIYNVTNLDWEVGEDYLVAFYYKGRLDASTRPILGFNLGWLTYCRGKISGSCSAWGSPWHECPDNSSRCCYFPLQGDCYPYVTMTSIPAGVYNDGPYNGWYLYFQNFTYTEGLSKLYDSSGNNYNEIGMSIGYNTTDSDGTEFFIDDFIVAQRVK